MVPGCWYLSPHCCVRCLVLQEHALCMEEPGKAHTSAHASLKGQGFPAHGAFSQHLRCMWNRFKLLEASPDFLCDFLLVPIVFY